MIKIPRGFWDQSQITDTASAVEVFIPIIALVYMLTWLVIWMWHRRTGTPVFRKNAPRWMICVACLPIPIFGLLAVVLAVFAFIPGDIAAR